MNIVKKKINPRYFILDVDGVLTDGSMIYDSFGKKFKIFGPDDNDSLQILKKFIKIYFVSGDKEGFAISEKRVHHMNFDIFYVPALQREKWIDKKFGLKNCIYMGDGIFDHLVMRKTYYSIAPNNSLNHILKIANYVTIRSGGQRAVAEASIHVLKKFFNIKINNIA
jgi:3-deoxy-D-manno-octulosonate 8-phosphate phosphatase (KDO 8-P phosphatase)